MTVYSATNAPPKLSSRPSVRDSSGAWIEEKPWTSAAYGTAPIHERLHSMHARKLVEKDEKRRASMQKVESTDPRTGQPVPLEAPKTFASARAAGSAAVFGTSPRVPLFVVEKPPEEAVLTPPLLGRSSSANITPPSSPSKQPVAASSSSSSRAVGATAGALGYVRHNGKWVREDTLLSSGAAVATTLQPSSSVSNGLVKRNSHLYDSPESHSAEQPPHYTMPKSPRSPRSPRLSNASPPKGKHSPAPKREPVLGVGVSSNISKSGLWMSVPTSVPGCGSRPAAAAASAQPKEPGPQSYRDPPSAFESSTIGAQAGVWARDGRGPGERFVLPESVWTPDQVPPPTQYNPRSDFCSSSKGP